MSSSRYAGKKIYLNKESLYKKRFEDRGIKHVEQYEFPRFNYPSTEQISKLEIVGHVWKLGDRFYKLAYQYYDDPNLWWIIAWFNQAPTESHINVGDVINIPFPLETVAILFKGK